MPLQELTLKCGQIALEESVTVHIQQVFARTTFRQEFHRLYLHTPKEVPFALPIAQGLRGYGYRAHIFAMGKGRVIVGRGGHDANGVVVGQLRKKRVYGQMGLHMVGQSLAKDQIEYVHRGFVILCF